MRHPKQIIITATITAAFGLTTFAHAEAPRRALLALPVEMAAPRVLDHPQPATEPLVFVSELVLPAGIPANHPLLDLVRKTWAGAYGEQPAWRLPLLVNGLKQKPRTARLTAFSSRCADGGGPTTRWGTRVRYGICAADPSYWGPGSVVWVGGPVASVLIVEDTGGAVRGRDRFDVALGDDAAACGRFGVRRATYVPLYVAPTRRNWGDKPRGWHPPVLPMQQVLVPLPASRAALAKRGPTPVRIAQATASH